MIDELLFKTNHLGKDGFIWWIGQVASKDYWKADSLHTNYVNQVGSSKNWPERCKVRIIGYHTFNENELHPNDLPWAHIMLDPMFGNGQGGEGMTSNLQGGEVCFGFFLDGDDAQQPVIVGLMSRPREVLNVSPDPSFAFRPFSGHSGAVPPTKRGTNSPFVIPTGDGVESTPPSPPPIQVPGSSTGDTPVTATFVNGDWGSTTGISTDNFQDLFNTKEFIFTGIGTSAFNFNLSFNDTIWTADQSAAIESFKKASTISYVPPAVCNNNFIGQITQILQDFIGLTNTFQKYADTYIDPVLNEVVDITSQIKSTASSIAGIIKLIINSIRGGLLKCITSLVKKFFKFVTDPQKPIFSQAFKNILNIIFCLIEKLMPQLIAFIEDLLTDMVDSVFSAPLCAINQWIDGLLTKVMDTLESVLEPILSGISWLTGGLSSVFNVLNQASNLANQIYNFIGCDQLKCTQPSKWVTNLGPSQMSADNWSETVQRINIFKGVADGLSDVESAIAGLSLYGKSSQYSDCNQKVNNPTCQEDLPTKYPGTILSRCFAPIITINDDGYGAKLKPIIRSGKLIAVEIVSGGFGYTSDPSLTVVDNTGYGKGAKLKAKVSKDGAIDKVIVLKMGKGYCNTEALCEPDEKSDVVLLIKPDKRRIYEGQSVTFTIVSNGRSILQSIDYVITGIESNYIKQNTSGTLNLKNGRIKFTVDTIPDDVVNTKKIKFSVPKYKKSSTVLVEDSTEDPDNVTPGDDGGGQGTTPEYSLTSTNYDINEGSLFTITLETKNVKDETIVPFKLSGVDSRLIENYNSFSSFKVVENKARITFRTNKGIINDDQIFRLELENKKASIGVLIYKLTSIPKEEPKLCLTGIELIRPGIGYRLTDTATDGVNNYELIISPSNGAVFGVKPLANPICGYDEPPFIIINTITGIGAELVPIMTLDDNNSNTIVTSDIAGIPTTETDSISIIDCI